MIIITNIILDDNPCDTHAIDKIYIYIYIFLGALKLKINERGLSIKIRCEREKRNIVYF